jgi:glycosyltransferase involved in cell wall biosynthesis
MVNKISVIIRTHNSEHFAQKALDSALNQTLSKELFDIVVVDDASTDSTPSILASYGDEIIVIALREVGAVKAANIGIKRARNKYFILLDADDTFQPAALECFRSVIERTKADFVYSDYYEEDANTGEVKIVSLNEDIFNSVAGGIMFESTVFERLGGYDEGLIFPEYDLLIRLMAHDYSGVHIPQPLFTYLRHRASLTANKQLVKRGIQQLRNRYGYPLTIRGY